MEFNAHYTEMKDAVEGYLAQRFVSRGELPFDGLLDAINYSLTAGGKRLRPILTLEFCRLAGGDVEKCLPVACAVEMLHTYSLIHDDLPCMDDDELRRGKPTNHKVFGECTAILAGDALQGHAFYEILTSDLPAERRANCAELLSCAAGVDGICGGQFMDMVGEGKTLTEDELFDIHGRKTCALIVVACQMGVAAAGGTDQQLEAAAMYAAALGLAFQIRDDMLDVIGDEAKLGKPIGSDETEGKCTLMTVLGETKCAELVDSLSKRASEIVSDGFEDADFLYELARSLAQREA